MHSRSGSSGGPQRRLAGTDRRRKIAIVHERPVRGRHTFSQGLVTDSPHTNRRTTIGQGIAWAARWQYRSRQTSNGKSPGRRPRSDSLLTLGERAMTLSAGDRTRCPSTSPATASTGTRSTHHSRAAPGARAWARQRSPGHLRHPEEDQLHALPADMAGMDVVEREGRPRICRRPPTSAPGSPGASVNNTEQLKTRAASKTSTTSTSR